MALIAAILGFGLSISVKAKTPDFIVAKDGSGDFTTVQAAINAVTSNGA